MHVKNFGAQIWVIEAKIGPETRVFVFSHGWLISVP